MAGREEVSRPDVTDVLRCERTVEAALILRGYQADILRLTAEDFYKRPALLRRIQSHRPDFIFNLFEGFSFDPAKEADFAAMLEAAGLAFTGNPSQALKACLDKAAAKEKLAAAGVPVPKGKVVTSHSRLEFDSLDFPVFLKPRVQDASVGIDRQSLVGDVAALNAGVATKLALFPEGLLIEEFIGGNEYQAAFIGEAPYEEIGLAMIDYSRFSGLAQFLTYQAKWDENSADFAIMPDVRAKLDPAKAKEIIATAVSCGQALDCRGYFRVDLREKNGELFVIDVNPNPDINCDSGFMKQAYRKGYSYESMVEKILRLSRRHA